MEGQLTRLESFLADKDAQQKVVIGLGILACLLLGGLAPSIAPAVENAINRIGEESYSTSVNVVPPAPTPRPTTVYPVKK